MSNTDGKAVLTNPPHHIYAYILAKNLPNRNLLGVAIDTRTGKTLESVVLPTRQRIMLALGVGNDNSHAHHKYRRITGNNYTLTWTDDPQSEPALVEMSERIKRVSAGVQRAIKQPELSQTTQRQIAKEQAKPTIIEQVAAAKSDMPPIKPPSPELLEKAREAERREHEDFQRKFVGASIESEANTEAPAEPVDWGW